MSIEIICIGTELLTGEITNTNLQFIAGQLDARGLVVARETCVHDTLAAVRNAVLAGLKEHRLVITVGGLGPTRDDLTREAVAEALGLTLSCDTELAERIRSKYSARGRNVPNHSWEVQAMVPQGGEPLTNDWGTAPGLWIPVGDRAVAMLPGPPRELQPMFDEYLLPKIADLVAPAVSRQVLSVFGFGESNTERRVIDALVGLDSVEPSYCAKADCCHVRLTVAVGDEPKLAEAVGRLKAEFGDNVASQQENTVTLIAKLLRERGWTFGTAESCTGGGISSMITDLPGISDVFAGSVVTYSNEMKEKLLGVRSETLAEYGAVSDPVARQMVTGLLARYDLQAGIAVTGIAGPDGGTEEKPVGTVQIATAVEGRVRCTRQVFPYGRRGMRERTVTFALQRLREHLLGRLAEEEN